MRRKDKEITNKTEIEAILKEAFICHLGLSDGDQPYVVPMNYGYEDGHIYLHCAAVGKKLDIIKKNNKVCFAVELPGAKVVKKDDQPCDWGMSFRSVIGYGTAELIEAPEEKIKALGIIVKGVEDRSFSFPEAEVKRTAVIDVTIQEMTGKASG